KRTARKVGKVIVGGREKEGKRMRRPVRPTREVPPEKPKPAEVVRKEAPPPLAPLPIEPAVRFGTWTQVFGDYQKRDAAGPGFLNCCQANLPIGVQMQGNVLGSLPTLALNIESRSSSVGFVAGADLTSSGLYSGFIGGVTAGYTWSELKLNTVATDVTSNIGPNAPAGQNLSRVGTGVSSLRATLSGP